MMRIYSIRERPEYIPAMLESLENHWPACISALSCLLMPAGRAAGWDLRGSIWPQSTATTMRSMDFSPLAPTPVLGESPPGCLKILHCHQK